jgi:hypothetical protein
MVGIIIRDSQLSNGMRKMSKTLYVCQATKHFGLRFSLRKR